ncbi:MAG: hypothetical protein IAG13_06240 [Deltaproteobacteria bacterium]|nr:hypothetical protein [Nannocystaceae bacterium]
MGLKHTILLAHVTLGSLINFCDVLMAGGSSRKDHSEVGSGFIHFNFTPWGRSGDKATASLVGDVIDGVMMRAPRIFLGGAGGMVGPRRVGYGAVAAAGQVLRRDVPNAKMVLQPPPAIASNVKLGHLDASEPRGARNLEYIAQLVALRAWYSGVRLTRASSEQRPVLLAACETLGEAIAERVTRVRSFLEERGRTLPELELEPPIACPIAPVPDGIEHATWLQAQDEEVVQRLRGWLHEIVQAVVVSRP